MKLDGRPLVSHPGAGAMPDPCMGQIQEHGVDVVFRTRQPGEMSMEKEQGPNDDMHLEAANAMMGLLNGSWAARLVHAAAELGIADHLVGEARDATFLAAATQAHAPSLARLLRALTAIRWLRVLDLS